MDWVRLCLRWVGWLALYGTLALNASVDAQVPVITNPSDIHYLDSNTALDPLGSNVWSVMSPMPTARAGAATVTTNDKIYVIGGEIVDSCDTTSVVEAYDPAANQWITGLAPLPPPTRWRPSTGTLGGLIYLVGGESSGAACGLVLDVVQAYDPVMNTWSDKPPVLTPRLQIGIGVDPVSNLLYAVGGSTAGPEFRALKTVEVFDPVTNSWTPRHELNIGRGFPAVAVIGGKVYAIGGQDSNHSAINTTEVYDPSSDTWTMLPSIIPIPRLNSAYTVIEGKVYILGGEGSQPSGLLSSLLIYDPSQDCELCGGEAWTIGVAMPTARTFLGVAQVNDILYAIGGEAAVARVGQSFTYQITATNNPTSFDASPLPEGLTVDHSLGLISGVPARADRAFQVTFTAANESGQSLPKQVSFSIEPAYNQSPDAPTFLNSTCVTGRAGEPFSFQVLIDNASPDTQLAATGFPYLEGFGSELTIDPGTGLISGTVQPAIDGSPQSFGATINAADGPTTSQSFLEMTFVSDPAFPVINSPSSGTLVLNQFFSYTITADAPADSFSYIGFDGLINGQLPLGLSYDSETSTISGIYSGNASSPRTGLARRTNNPITDTIKKEPPPHIQLLANGNAGVGIAPLNFITTLHDFEVEVLRSSVSRGTGYVIFSNDPLASAGAAGLLESTGPGDFVSYTLPNVLAGTYDVVVGAESGAAQGIFQLSIDSQKQGIPEDEYSSIAAYEARDLGTVTFADTGSKTFTFRIVGHNPESIGYQLVLDFIDLVPHSEAESLVVQANSAPYVNKHDRNLSGHSGTYFKATQVGDYLTYTVPVAVAGRYDISVGTTSDNDRGIFELSVDGVNQGYAQNEYAPSPAYHTLDLGTVNFETAGDKTLTFSVAGKDGSSTDYRLLFDYISLNLSTKLEAEELSTRTNARLYTLSDQNLSDGSGIILVATTTGQYVTYIVDVPVAGTYHVKAGVRTANNCGMFQLAVEGRDQGLPVDEYSAVSDYAVLDLGAVSFTNGGDKSFRFTVTGKDASSLGYQISLDYIALVR